MCKPTEQADKVTPRGTVTPPNALVIPNPGAALRNVVTNWAEANTRPETLARAEKLRDKVATVTSFFDFSRKHPGDVMPASWPRRPAAS